MSAVVAVNPKLPAAFRQAAVEAADEFTSGVVSGFPVLSYRGRVWRVKKGGEEQVYLDENEEAVQAIQIVLLRANPKLGKIFYRKKYEEGSVEAPDCWSGDGIKPDAAVPNPVSTNCATCPNNVWGSKISETGKKTRACSDHRRMAIAFIHDIEQALEDPNHEVTPMLLRTPPASLNPLKAYVESKLKPKGIPPFAVVTRISFDTDVSHPQLKFKATAFLSDEHAEIVMKLRESDEVARILSEPEHAPEETTADGSGEVLEDASASSSASEPKKASAASSGSSKKLSPVEEEEIALDDDDEDDEPEVVSKGKGKTVTLPDDDDDDDDDELTTIQAPAKKTTTKKAATKKAPAKKAAAKKEAKAEDDGEQSFDDMLSSILDD